MPRCSPSSPQSESATFSHAVRARQPAPRCGRNWQPSATRSIFSAPPDSPLLPLPGPPGVRAAGSNPAPPTHPMKILNTITYTTRDGNGQRHEWTIGIRSPRKLGVIEAEKLLKRKSPSAIVTRVESLIDSR